MTLIAYAGKELLPSQPRYERAYDLFQRGRDTRDIADIMRITETRALRYVTMGRCIHRSLPSPYKHKD